MRKLDHDQRRREIAEAAARLIAADGMAALTTRGIARAMGCSIGVLSHYFESKAAIVTAAFAWASSAIHGRASRGIPAGVQHGTQQRRVGAACPGRRRSRWAPSP